ncbi:hypothetical protein RHSIM_Rhsim08G0120500 [Rhododendron simsii]|uniref:Uncharacterized protein n=1 Tax=Rhododendron simsii TaxID=118357 RepID=A0A834GIU0_RHOSS|nr:hypothetical protein RHSIM_Rhsim08G0120500 [Rhododendron simsii]
MASVNMSTTINEGAPHSQQQVPSTPSESQQPSPVTIKLLGATYAWTSSNGTSTLRNRLQKCTHNPFKKDKKKQKTLQFQTKVEGEKGESSLGLWKFDQVACWNALAKMIIIVELPFKFVDHEGFREFCTVMQPYFNEISRMSTAVNERAPQSQQRVPSTPSESQQPCPATMKVISPCKSKER